MKQKVQTKDVGSQASLWQDCLLSFCIALFFGLFILSPHVSQADSIGKKTTHFYKVNLHSDHHQPVRLPVESFPNALEPEIPDGRESDDQSNEWSALEGSLSLDNGREIISNTSSFFHFVRAVENRSRISLVVLHHSWKSFFTTLS
jgi:hypothetical protein